jgi:hypothetical protein
MSSERSTPSSDLEYKSKNEDKDEDEDEDEDKSGEPRSDRASSPILSFLIPSFDTVLISTFAVNTCTSLDNQICSTQNSVCPTLRLLSRSDSWSDPSEISADQHQTLEEAERRLLATQLRSGGEYHLALFVPNVIHDDFVKPAARDRLRHPPRVSLHICNLPRPHALNLGFREQASDKGNEGIVPDGAEHASADLYRCRLFSEHQGVAIITECAPSDSYCRWLREGHEDISDVTECACTDADVFWFGEGHEGIPDVTQCASTESYSFWLFSEDDSSEQGGGAEL